VNIVKKRRENKKRKNLVKHCNAQKWANAKRKKRIDEWITLAHAHQRGNDK
jgi:hypothetical protein